MTSPMRMTIVLDTPNLNNGVATAGLPARMVNLATALKASGVDVSFILGDRGMTVDACRAWSISGFLVNPRLIYGAPELLVPCLQALKPDLIVLSDTKITAVNGPVWAAESGARLVYEAHDDEQALAEALGEPSNVVASRANWQRAAASVSHYVTVLTSREHQLLKGYGVKDERLLIAPIGIDVGERTEWGAVPSARRLVFIGNLFYEPNARAVRFIRQLVASVDNVRARIIGRGPAELCTSSDTIEFTGALRNLNDGLADVSLALAPLDVGSGQKSKLLDYQGAGLPTLATTEAVNGLLSGQHGTIVSDQLSMWPSIVTDLLAQPDLLKRLGGQARLSVQEHHDWRDIAARAVVQYRSWLDAAPPELPLTAVTNRDDHHPSWLTEHAQKLGLGDPQLTNNKDFVRFGSNL